MTSLYLPEHVAAAREKQLNAVQGVVSDAYVAAEDRVFDPSKLSESALERLPTPTGWRMLLLPFQGKKKSDGGVFIPDQVREREQLATVCGYILKLGPDCYKDAAKFPNGPWCKEGDWVIFGRYAGSRFKIEGGEVRLLNDDEILAKISDPNDIVHI
jgi:chaperonin GroES